MAYISLSFHHQITAFCVSTLGSPSASTTQAASLSAWSIVWNQTRVLHHSSHSLLFPESKGALFYFPLSSFHACDEGEKYKESKIHEEHNECEEHNESEMCRESEECKEHEECEKQEECEMLKDCQECKECEMCEAHEEHKMRWIFQLQTCKILTASSTF
ncbi:hypothetical protein Baya_12568 [Bagarius yarrelli]|uniref:Uncharacterized protein n=1 Tax=Bagarius yarrelli TaxID=175774 RepID=A0A556V3L1_BAGYA|nr:hypothetical protein Baya_12568 [Bagarius yarrelli]